LLKHISDGSAGLHVSESRGDNQPLMAVSPLVLLLKECDNGHGQLEFLEVVVRLEVYLVNAVLALVVSDLHVLEPNFKHGGILGSYK